MVKSEVKDIFLTVFSNKGDFIWTMENKRDYFFAVKKKNDLNAKGLSDAELMKLSAEELLEKLLPYDKDLALFQNYQKNFEVYARKLIEVYKIDLSSEDIDGLKKIKSKPYSFETSEEWSCIGEDVEDSKISFIYAKETNKPSIANLKREDIPEELWESIVCRANEKANTSGGKLVVLNAKLVSPTRMIMKITTDIEKGFVEFACDDYSVNDDGKKINDTIVQATRKKDFKTILDELPITETTKKDLSSKLDISDGIFTEELIDAISSYSNEEMIIVPTIQKFDCIDDTTQEYSERVTSDLYKQKESRIKATVKEYYEQNGTLDGYFSKHTEHNVSNAHYTGQLNDDNSASRKFLHVYCFIVREASELEKSIETQGYLKGKIIDSVSIDFDCANNEMNTRNNYYSKETYELIFSKLLQLSQNK